MFDATDRRPWEPKERSPATLSKLLTIMQCPRSKTRLIKSIDEPTKLVSEAGLIWDCHDHLPIFFNRGAFEVYPVDHLSNALAENAVSLIEKSAGLVLNLSAGGSERWWPHVIEIEAGLFRNTDVIGDAHNLPFCDGVFDACVAMNAFEHYSTPHVAAAEILRVLKPGGTVLIHTAFLQPVHEPPFHYFNATRFGVSKWFENFEIESISTSSNFNPLYAISWILSDLIGGLEAADRADDAAILRGLTVEEMLSTWRGKPVPDLITNIFNTLPITIMDNLAAGVELVARKS